MISHLNLGECCKIISGSTPDTSNPEYWGGDIVWITPKDLSETADNIITNSSKKITKKGYDSCSTQILPKGTVLLSSRAPIGLVAIAGKELCTNQGFKSLIPDTSLVLSKYLMYWLRYKKEFLNSLGNGATFKEISKKTVENIKVSLPSIEEQKRIASILDKANELKENRKKAIDKLDELVQSVFIDMFGDPVENTMKWPKKRMEELMTIRRGASPRPIDSFLGGIYPWIKIGDATNEDDIYITDSKEKIIEDGLKKTVYLKKGSLIFANCGVSLGFARIIKIDGCIHDGWLSFSDINETKIDKIFLLKTLNHITEYFRSIAPSGTQPNLNTDIMKNFQLIVPPLELQHKFVEFLNTIMKIKSIFKTSLIKINDLKSSLNNKFFREK